MAGGANLPITTGSMKPILWVLTSTFPRWAGDAEPPFVFDLSRRLAGRFHVVVLAPRAPRTAERETFAGVEVRRYGYFLRPWERLAYDGGILGNLKRRPWLSLLIPFLLLGQWRAVRKLLREYPADVVHAHWLFPQAWVAMMALPAHIPLVATSHGSDLYRLQGRFWDFVRLRVARRCASVTVVSEPMRQRLTAQGVSAEKVDVIPMGVDLVERFCPAPVTRRRPGEILFVGRLVSIKGCAELLRAAAVLRSGGRDVWLRIVGDGPERVPLQRLAHQLRIDNVVEFVGGVANEKLPEFYRRAAALIAPFVADRSGAREGLGLVPVEAMGCGCPVVTTQSAANNALIQDGLTAWIAESSSPEALAEAIAALLDDPDEARVRANSARTAVIARFHWDAIAGRYESILRNACRGAD